ncbi:MAG: nitrilase-related carbon-nitrogen hydrolase, partial [Nitriliruptoraceae bacterium]
MADPGVQPSRVRSPRVLRCVAVGLHLDPDRAATPARLLEGIEELLRQELDHGGEGVGEADGGPGGASAAATLVALPEHTGLLAMLVGERGAEARARWRDGGTTLDILLALAGSYGEELGQLAARYPEVRSAGQLLHLVTCDTVVHTLVEGLGQVAARLGVWISVGAGLPRWSWQPAPDGPGRRRVAVPTGPQVRNRQLLLAPTGELAAVHDKVTLVPLEADAEAGLGLEPASLAGVEVADLAIGRLGTVISKDAWMPDVNERLAQLGAQVLLQPEAFDRWGAPDHDEATGQRDLWPPDKFQRGGWWMLQRHPGFRVNLAPMLLGDLGELAFDGQAVVAVSSPAGEPGLGLLGQPADDGWAAVGPWWRDPAISGAVAGSSVAGSRAEAARVRTAASERAAAPADRGGDHLAIAAVALPWGPVAGDTSVPRLAGLGASTEVAASDGPVPDDGLQLVPDVAVDRDRVWVAWIACDTAGRQQVRCTVSPDSGRTWDASRALSPGPEDVAATADGTAAPDGPRPQAMVPARRWAPRLAVVDGTPVCVHLGSPVGSWDVLAVRADRAESAAPVRVDDADPEAGVLRERLHDSPVVLAHDGALVAVWSDLRWPWVLPQVRVARSADAGMTWSPSSRADGGPLEGEPDPLAGRSPAETRGQATPAAVVVDG